MQPYLNFQGQELVLNLINLSRPIAYQCNKDSHVDQETIEKDNLSLPNQHQEEDSDSEPCDMNKWILAKGWLQAITYKD